LLALVPFAAGFGPESYVLGLFSRVMVFAIAALALDFICGYGGLVSFGHAAFVGIGAYAVGILGAHGITDMLVSLPTALLASAIFAYLTGNVCLRTKSVYFIMITLAFAQMAFYVASGLERYGGDDGLTIYKRSTFAGALDLSNKPLFYYLCLALLLAVIWLVRRLVDSRFGLVIQGVRSNERRMRAIGFSTFRYKLVCFVISGVLCGLAGVLLANHTDFVSPAIMQWTRSGDLIVMAVLGGMGTVMGPVIGAVTLLVLEEALSRVTEYWPIILGPLILLVVLYARGGIDGLLARLGRG
jgi:branched-chain amino acid transport system permease protein